MKQILIMKKILLLFLTTLLLNGCAESLALLGPGAANGRLLQSSLNSAISYGVHHIFEDEIDKINILNASIKAMHGAIEKLNQTPEFIIVDGNKFKPYLNIPYETIVKGDSKYQNIAAASILAKTYRDIYMEKIHDEFPMYNWKQNKGYPTKEHREAIKQYGITKYHRKSFKLVPDQLKLEF